MSEALEAKRERVHLRLDARAKRRLERAAAYEARSVSDFVLANALAAADRVIEARETVTLTAPDWELFYTALIDPPAPTPALERAVRRYLTRGGG